MSETLDNARVYARIAILRRKVLLAQTLRRIAAGVVAIVALLIAMGFGTRAAYLALVPPLGPLWATVVMGGAWALVGLVLLIYAGSTPKSAALTELTAMENAAKARTELSIARIRYAGAQAETVTGKAMVAFRIFNTIRRMLRR